MEINRWKGLENQYNKILKDGYAFKKETEHLHHSEMDEAQKEKKWNMHIEKWIKEGWLTSQEMRCEWITLTRDNVKITFVMNVWCGCISEQTAK